jgi:hypothetical protein
MAFLMNDMDDYTVKIDTTREDIALKSKMQDGFVVARNKFTKSRKTFTLELQLIPEASFTGADSLEEFYDSVGTTVSFQWIHPLTLTSYQVRFNKPLEDSLTQKRLKYHDTTIELVEV